MTVNSVKMSQQSCLMGAVVVDAFILKTIKLTSCVVLLCRSFSQQGHAVGRHAALAPGDPLQCQQPLLQEPHARRVSWRRWQLQRLHVSSRPETFILKVRGLRVTWTVDPAALSKRNGYMSKNT